MYQAWDVVFHHQMKHREESWKYDEQWSIFNKLRGVSSGDETLCRYYFSNKMILEGEIKDAKLKSFHLIPKHSLYINFFCIFFMNY